MALEVSAPTSVGRSGSQSDSIPEQKGFLLGSVKKYIVTALCISGAIATREVLGFENTAMGIIAIPTAFGIVSFGLLLGPHFADHSGKRETIPYCAELGGALGFGASLVALAAFESTFQMLQTMKGFID